VVDEHPKPSNAPLKTSNQNYGPMLDLLKLAGKELDEGTLEKLPDWSTVTSVIGAAEPILFGLEKCASFDKDEIILAAAGMFNLGTNHLHELLKLNCQMQSAKYQDLKGRPRLRVQWQVPWGKHEPPKMRYNIENTIEVQKLFYTNGTWNPAIILPVVSIRDPYTWMQSMCRSRYQAHWFVTDAHCPNLDMDTVDLLAYCRGKDCRPMQMAQNCISDEVEILLANHVPDESHVPVEVRYQALNMTHESLVHL
jgi:hypothetical protein